jgi:citrate synthase
VAGQREPARGELKEQKIARPRQVYTGERDRDYVALDERG